MNGTNGNKVTMDMDLDREVIRCKTCGLVQFRARMGNCRRCQRLVPPKMDFPIAPLELPGDARQGFEKWPNRDPVENVGRRMRQLRELRGMTQRQLQERSRVSRSYLSRIESGQMTPSLGTLEKISEALGVALNRFFSPMLNRESLLEDLFIQRLAPFLRRLEWEQWQSILERLAAISRNASVSNAQMRPLAQSKLACMDDMARRAN